MRDRLGACIGLVVGGLIASANLDVLGFHPSNKFSGDAAQLLSIDQRWDLFAPDPARRSYSFHVELDTSSGETERHAVEFADRGIRAYESYRWRKFLRRAASSNDPELLDAVAAALVSRQGLNGDGSARLYITVTETPEPGHEAGPSEVRLIHRHRPPVRDG